MGGMEPRTAEAADLTNLPKPSPELVLLRVLLESHLETMPRKKRLQFVRHVMDIIQAEAAMEHIVSFRPKSDGPATAQARTQALAWMRHTMGRLLIRLG